MWQSVRGEKREEELGRKGYKGKQEMEVKKRWTGKERGERRGKAHNPGRIEEGQHGRGDERRKAVDKMRGRNR